MSNQNPKKRKRPVVLHQAAANANGAELDTSKPTALFQAPGKGRHYTVSIALPGSIIANATTRDRQAALAGTIARAAAVFCVDEIVVFNDSHISNSPYQPKHPSMYSIEERNNEGYTGFSDPDHFLYYFLTFLETPQYLRNPLFPVHFNLDKAGAQPSIDLPHHLREHEWCQYREGRTINPKADGWQGPPLPEAAWTLDAKRRKNNPQSSSNPAGDAAPTLIYAGLDHPIVLVPSPPTPIPPNTRITVKFSSPNPPAGFPYLDPAAELSAEAVDPAAPREEGGYYWGYSTRLASTLSSVFTESPWEGGYDISIGTSERGVPLSSVLPTANSLDSTGGNEKSPSGHSAMLPTSFRHLLIVFGGVAGLERAAQNDSELQARGIGPENVGDLFDAWVNLVPGQGSRTIRAEEAVWIGLMGLREYVTNCGYQ